ncbi:MAG: hypothetical protein JSS76_08260 [Bacteroidetes bacterium]|nr:hypothetical protein [Bacteroidota bacterium]
MEIDKDILDLKNQMKGKVKYEEVATKLDGNVTLADIKRFFSGRSVPFEKQIQIISTAQILLLEKNELLQAAFAGKNF